MLEGAWLVGGYGACFLEFWFGTSMVAFTEG